MLFLCCSDTHKRALSVAITLSLRLYGEGRGLGRYARIGVVRSGGVRLRSGESVCASACRYAPTTNDHVHVSTPG